MSQEKVDKYKQEKYNRKNTKKKANIKKIVYYVIATIIAIAFLIYLGYSIAVSTGLYKLEPKTTHIEWSSDQIESLRNNLIQQGDSNVRGNTSKSKETQTTTPTTTKKTAE